MHIINNVIVGSCFIIGSLLSLTAAIGLIRFPNTLMRMHAATKPQTLGLLLIIMGTAFYKGTSVADTGLLSLAAAFTLLTAPATGHRIGRLAFYEQYLNDKTLNKESAED